MTYSVSQKWHCLPPVVVSRTFSFTCSSTIIVLPKWGHTINYIFKLTVYVLFCQKFYSMQYQMSSVVWKISSTVALSKSGFESMTTLWILWWWLLHLYYFGRVDCIFLSLFMTPTYRKKIHKLGIIRKIFSLLDLSGYLQCFSV